MKSFLILFSFLISYQSKSQNFTGGQVDSLDQEKWKASLPYCDSIKAWYYMWSYQTPDYKANGWGEYTLCQWNKPTKQQILKEMKKWFDKDKFKYVKIDIIAISRLDPWCPCQQRKKAF